MRILVRDQHADFQEAMLEVVQVDRSRPTAREVLEGAHEPVPPARHLLLEPLIQHLLQVSALALVGPAPRDGRV